MSRPEVALAKEDRAMHAGGTVTYRVHVGGRWIGWVGDGRPWRGHRYGGRKWWACWREVGDASARWSTDLDYASRAAALGALTAAGQRHRRPEEIQDEFERLVGRMEELRQELLRIEPPAPRSRGLRLVGGTDALSAP